jgi:hypothetical protein
MNSTPMLFTLTCTRLCITLVFSVFCQAEGTNVIQYCSLLELALSSRMIQRRNESNANEVLAQEGNCYVNLASQRHCAGVFIGA